jgi:hypothetical protein
MASTTVNRFMNDVKYEVERAKELFPNPYGVLAALTEEVGEVAKASMDEPMDHVYTEAVQVAAMACRLATEFDPSLMPIRKERNSDGKQVKKA